MNPSTDSPASASSSRRPSAPTVEIWIGVLATALIAAGVLLYALQEPGRLENAQAAQLQRDLDEAMTLYAENCSVCHGLAGEGIGATPPLDNPGLRESEPETLFKIISRGLHDTAMPAWNKEGGGPLSDYQIGQLVDLIRFSDWQAVQDRVVNLGLAPSVPFTAEADPEILAQVAALPDGDLLSQGITLYAEQCVACHGPDGSGTSLAPALNDPTVRAKSSDKLSRTILNGVPGSLMASWGNVLSNKDITALVTLFTRWDEIPAGAVPAPDVPVPVTEESLALGKQLFAQDCARCHGPEGQGTPRAPALNVKGYLEETSDMALQQIITLGVPGTAMPSWGDRLSEAQIQAIVGFIRSWEPTAPEVAEPARGGGGPWWQTEGDTRVGGPPSWAGQGQDIQGESNQPAAGGAQTHPVGSGPPYWAEQGKGGNGEHPEGETPPWAAAEQAQPWWQSLDWRGWAFILSGAALSFGLMGVAFWGLQRL